MPFRATTQGMPRAALGEACFQIAWLGTCVVRRQAPLKLLSTGTAWRDNPCRQGPQAPKLP
ncbi:hypothetical protein DEO72_LG4g664 [Vigna unguiculata]|uniref:Uncharacterized protein n=1 Tax=Vigna unguiculata TaxID=3917 RepID=A0A4D6LML9_VIGUN|nr:hypothetical protein DEO72_LG4g664 [Vigna unguiculata]